MSMIGDNFPTTTDLRVMTQKALHNTQNGRFNTNDVEAYLKTV